MAKATITSNDGIILSYSRSTDSRVVDAVMSGLDVALVTARSCKEARELAAEAEAWGADVEIEGPALKIAF
jgi:dihydrodipicolinate synthase/N-acetylneuraminate lyase